MNVEQYHIAKLADAMYAAGTTISERSAVGCMIRNRALDLGSWHDAIQSMSFWYAEKNPHSPEFLTVLWLAEEIFYNRRPDVTHGSDKFTDSPEPGSVQVGRWFFYKKEKAGSELVTADLVEPDSFRSI